MPAVCNFFNILALPYLLIVFCVFALFHSNCSPAQVLGAILVHEFQIFLHKHIECILIFISSVKTKHALETNLPRSRNAVYVLHTNVCIYICTLPQVCICAGLDAPLLLSLFGALNYLSEGFLGSCLL